MNYILSSSGAQLSSIQSLLAGKIFQYGISNHCKKKSPAYMFSNPPHEPPAYRWRVFVLIRGYVFLMINVNKQCVHKFVVSRLGHQSIEVLISIILWTARSAVSPRRCELTLGELVLIPLLLLQACARIRRIVQKDPSGSMTAFIV